MPDTPYNYTRRAATTQVNAEWRDLANGGSRLTLAMASVLSALEDWPVPLYADEADTVIRARSRAADVLLDLADDFLGDATAAHDRRADEAGTAPIVIDLAELRARAQKLGRE